MPTPQIGGIIVEVGLCCKRENMMKRFLKILVVSLFLTSILFSVVGCGSYERMGETNAEVKRRHARNERLRKQAMMEDLEALFLMDNHLSTTERSIP